MGNRILMIEDDAAIAEAVKLNLECADYAVTVFDNGLAARDALEVDHNYDLALLDMMLPGLDGFALLPELRRYPRDLSDRHGGRAARGAGASRRRRGLHC